MTDLDKLEALAKAAAADNTNPDYFAAVQSLDLLHRECTPEAILDLIASARRDAEEIERLRARERDDTLAFQMINVGEDAVPEHWRFRCDALKIAQMRLKARAAHTGEG